MKRPKTTYGGVYKGSGKQAQPTGGEIASLPPPGKCKILNIYWDPVLQRAIFEYDDKPVS